MNKWWKRMCQIGLVAIAAGGIGGQTTCAAALRPAGEPLTSNQTTSLRDVHSFTIYYGEPSRTAIAKLRAYRLVIIEPRLWSADQIADLEHSGSKVLGYLSVLEQNDASALLAAAQADDYLLVKGQRDRRTEWNSWSMNINSTHYRELLAADYEQQIVQKGLNGVLLDTMGDADDAIWSPEISASQRDGAVQFVAELRANHPDKSIVQNWGVGELKDRTAPYLDGILWEGFAPTVVSEDLWSADRMQELDRLEATSGLRVFTTVSDLQGAERDAFAKLNRQHGYVGHVMPADYETL